MRNEGSTHVGRLGDAEQCQQWLRVWQLERVLVAAVPGRWQVMPPLLVIDFEPAEQVQLKEELLAVRH